MPDPVPDPVSVTLDREEWQALLNAVTVSALGYDSPAWGAFQAIARAIYKPKVP